MSILKKPFILSPRNSENSHTFQTLVNMVGTEIFEETYESTITTTKMTTIKNLLSDGKYTEEFDESLTKEDKLHNNWTTATIKPTLEESNNCSLIAQSAEPTKTTTKSQRRQTFQPKKVSEPIIIAKASATTETPLKGIRANNSLYARIFGRSPISRDFIAPTPASRSVIDGPVDFQSVAAPVRATNPVLDELLHALELLSMNSPELSTLDLKDCHVLSISLCTALSSALIENTNLKVLSLMNCKITTASAMEMAEALRMNKGLEVLDLGSNLISPLGMRSIGDMLAHNGTLRELKLNQQHQMTGTEAEQCFAKNLMKNQSLQKLSLVIRDVSSRNSVDRSVGRNKEIARKLRFAASKA